MTVKHALLLFLQCQDVNALASCATAVHTQNVVMSAFPAYCKNEL